jgi:putative aldouronate transport system permease protein
MKSIPESLEESAQLEGAGYFRIFISIISPLCKPVYAAIGLFIAVNHWNSWFDALIYNRMDPKLTTLQYEIMKNLSTIIHPGGVEFKARQYIGSLRAAMIVVTMLPFIVIYPFFQRFFITGLKVGGIKD